MVSDFIKYWSFFNILLFVDEFEVNLTFQVVSDKNKHKVLKFKEIFFGFISYKLNKFFFIFRNNQG